MRRRGWRCRVWSLTRALADFYRSLLGWEIERDEPGWVKLRSHDGGPGLSFCLSLPG
jgi:hypothetical protein